jgi:hypothetical protein
MCNPQAHLLQLKALLKDEDQEISEIARKALSLLKE